MTKQDTIGNKTPDDNNKKNKIRASKENLKTLQKNTKGNRTTSGQTNHLLEKEDSILEVTLPKLIYKFNIISTQNQSSLWVFSVCVQAGGAVGWAK